jgi:hypothetical protein
MWVSVPDEHEFGTLPPGAMECERPQSDQAVLLWTGSRVDQQMIDFPDERTHLLRAETRFAVWIDAADQQGSYVRLRDQSIEVACRIK